MYDSFAGRWTSEDPIGFAAGDANPDRYVGNNSPNLTDPSGLEAQPGGQGPPPQVQQMLQLAQMQQRSGDADTRAAGATLAQGLSGWSSWRGEVGSPAWGGRLAVEQMAAQMRAQGVPAAMIDAMRQNAAAYIAKASTVRPPPDPVHGPNEFDVDVEAEAAREEKDREWARKRYGKVPDNWDGVARVRDAAAMDRAEEKRRAWAQFWGNAGDVWDGIKGVPIELGNMASDVYLTGIQGTSLIFHEAFGTPVVQVELSSHTFGGYEQACRQGEGNAYWLQTFYNNGTLGGYGLVDAVIRGDMQAARRQAGGMLWLAVPYAVSRMGRGQVRAPGEPGVPPPEVVDAARPPAEGLQPNVADAAAPPAKPGVRPNNEPITVQVSLDLQEARQALGDPIHDAYTNPLNASRAPATPLTRGQRLGEYFDRLGKQPASRTADEALGRVGRTLEEVEDALSGIPKKTPPPPPKMPDGRMYPPQADNIVRNTDGSISARTAGHRIEIGADGSITIRNIKTGEIDFHQPGAGGGQ
jgi:hypothetical protein